MKVSAPITFWLFWQTFLHPGVQAKLKVTVLSVKLKETSSKFVNIVKFDISPDSFLNCEADLLQNLTSVSLEALSNKNGTLTTIVKTPNYNFCSALLNIKKKEISIVNMITQQLLKSVVLSVTNCPIPIGRILFKNFHLDGSKIPLMVPSGLYYIYFNILTMEKRNQIIIARQGFDVKVERI